MNIYLQNASIFFSVIPLVPVVVILGMDYDLYRGATN